VFRAYAIPVILGAVQGIAVWCSRSFDQGTLGWHRSVLALSLLAVLTPLLAATNAWRERREEKKNEARAALLGTLGRVADNAEVPIDQIGASVFLVTWRWATFRSHQGHDGPGWKFWRWLQREQVSLARVRLTKNPPPSGIRWTRGKGLVGVCWRNPGKVWSWPDPARKEFRDRYLKCSAAEWQEVPRANRMGFSHQEWEIIQRYAGAFAAPINKNRPLRRPKYAGCVTLDFLDPGAYWKIKGDDDSRKDIEELLMGVASSLA
jgi:hypothetical protein